MAWGGCGVPSDEVAPARLLALPLLTLLALAAIPAEGACAAYSKVKYELTLTYTTSTFRSITAPADQARWYRAYAHEEVSRGAYTLKSATPFWVTRVPGTKPRFSGGTNIVAVGGADTYRSDTRAGAAWSWEWWEYGYAARSLHGSASLDSSTSPRVRFGFITTPGVARTRVSHLNPLGPGEPERRNYTNANWHESRTGTTRPVDLRKHFGRPFTARLSESTTSRVCTSIFATGTEVCSSTRRSEATLRFTPVAWVAKRTPGSRTPARPRPEEIKPDRQRWQIDVLGSDRWWWGVLTGLRAGLDVDWRQRTRLMVDGDKIISATSAVSVLNARPISEPPGVFTITPTPTAKTWPAYKLPHADKRGSRVTLNYYARSGHSHTYRVDYAIRLTGPEALSAMRASGVPDPDIRYAELQKLGTGTDTAATFVPDPARLVFLLRTGKPQKRGTDALDTRTPCPGATAEQCLLSRGAQLVIVTKL